jgi:hypothetical protein
MAYKFYNHSEAQAIRDSNLNALDKPIFINNEVKEVLKDIYLSQSAYKIDAENHGYSVHFLFETTILRYYEVADYNGLPTIMAKHSV